MFQLFKKNAAPPSEWVRRWSPDGLVIARGAGHGGGVHLRDPMVGGFLTQLADDGLAVEVEDGFLLGWDALYAAITDAAYASLPEVLSTPPFTKARPILQSSNSLPTCLLRSIAGLSNQSMLASTRWPPEQPTLSVLTVTM